MIEWIKPGFLTSWQDGGRRGIAHWGVPPGGPMDPLAAQLAALLLHQPLGSPVVESHFPGPQIDFHQSTMFSIAGADFGARLSSGRSLKPGGRYRIDVGERLIFEKKIKGEWVYLGWNNPQGLPTWKGSVQQPIRLGEKFEVSSELLTEKQISLRWESEASEIRFIPRPTESDLTSKWTTQILPESNRMGIRLAGNWAPIPPQEMYSAGVVQGTLQRLPNGQLIALMADHQTTGGYPVLGEIIRADLGKLAQQGVGKTVRLVPISVEEAWQIQADIDQMFKKISLSLTL